MCTHGLEAGIQHCGVDAVAGLLGPDTGRRPDLGQQRGAVRRGMHAGQTGEGGTELDAPRGQRQPDLLATDRARVRGQQTIEIAARRLEPVLDRVQGRGRAPDSLPGVVGLHGERRDTGRIDRRDGGHSGLLVKQQHLFEGNVADLGRVAERSASRGQRHLTVGSRGKGRHSVDLVVGEPRQCRGADFSLPRVALGLLRQPHMRTQQRMHRNGESAAQAWESLPSCVNVGRCSGPPIQWWVWCHGVVGMGGCGSGGCGVRGGTAVWVALRFVWKVRVSSTSRCRVPMLW